MKQLLFVALLLLPACGPKKADLKPALNAITSDNLMRHVKVLAADDFEGRAPASPGEEKTVNYLVSEFKKLGLAPGNPDGTYVQAVPLAGITSTVNGYFTAGGRRLPLTFEKDFVGVSRPLQPTNAVSNSDIVFVGYGVVAPEYGWDDYKGVDMTGKTLLMLINDPPLPDESMFKGKAMTYYGRWTYKYEIASEKKAAAVILIHETGPAGYPWEVVTGSWGAENFDLQRPDRNMGRVPVESWISTEKANELLKACGKDLAALKAAALGKDFRPLPLGAKATFTASNKIREVNSRNVIAKLEGSDPKLKDEYIVYTAHWDHMGMSEKPVGDRVYNGALDNASGVAVLLNIAEAFTRLDPKPRRSILFLSVTAEEKGLLGARYYAENPLYPHNKTLANINMDGFNQWGLTEDVVIVGMGNSTLEDVLAESAKGQGRIVDADPEPEKGFYYRSDHFEFAKKGVPALYTDSGDEFIDKEPGYGRKKRDAYTMFDYHKVSDEIKPDWDLAGAVRDTQLLFEVGHRVSETDQWPEWKSGAEFKALREASLKAEPRP